MQNEQVPEKEKIATELSTQSREEIERQTQDIQKRITALSIKWPDEAAVAKDIEKECTSLEKLIEAKRVEIVKPLNDFVSWINAQAKELVAPVTKAKEDIRNKQIEYAQEIERQRLAKEKEVLDLIAKVNQAPDEVELELLADTITHPDFRIKAAIETRRGYFEEQERMARINAQQEAERQRLAKIAEEQWAEAARLAKLQADENLKLQQAADEKKRQEEDERRQQAEDLASLQQEQAQKSADASKVKGLRKVVKFEVTESEKVPRILCSPDDAKIRESLKSGIREIPGVRIWAEDKIQ